MRYVLNIFIVTVVGAIAVVSAAAAQSPLSQFGVSPSRFELTLGARGATDAFRVFNLSQKTLDLQVSVHNWELDEHFEVQVAPPTEQSLDQWMHINPVRFTIEPEHEQVVRFAIRPKVRPQPGEHRAVLYVCEVPSAQEAQGHTNIIGCLGLVVYGNVPEVRRIGQVQAVEIVPETNPIGVRLEIASKGNAHVRLHGQYAIWEASAYPGAEHTQPLEQLNAPDTPLPDGIVTADALPALPVLAGAQRTLEVTTSPTLAPGEYVLDLHGDLSGDSPFDRGIPFVIK